jgi:hypothetical protein
MVAVEEIKGHKWTGVANHLGHSHYDQVFISSSLSPIILKPLNNNQHEGYPI